MRDRKREREREREGHGQGYSQMRERQSLLRKAPSVLRHVLLAEPSPRCLHSPLITQTAIQPADQPGQTHRHPDRRTQSNCGQEHRGPRGEVELGGGREERTVRLRTAASCCSHGQLPSTLSLSLSPLSFPFAVLLSALARLLHANAAYNGLFCV